MATSSDASATDPRAAVEYRVPAVDLRAGDLVNTSPGEDDWQQVLGVFLRAADTDDDELTSLVESLDGRYVVVQLTDIAPVDSGVYFAAGTAMVYGGDESSDQTVAESVSDEDGVRTYLYTKFELVTIRRS